MAEYAIWENGQSIVDEIDLGRALRISLVVSLFYASGTGRPIATTTNPGTREA